MYLQQQQKREEKLVIHPLWPVLRVVQRPLIVVQPPIGYGVTEPSASPLRWFDNSLKSIMGVAK